MAIWFGDWAAGRQEPGEDMTVLYWGMWPGNGGAKPLAQKVTPGGRLDGPPWTWEGEIPPEHPDDVATDRRILGEMADTGSTRRLLATLPAPPSPSRRAGGTRGG